MKKRNIPIDVMFRVLSEEKIQIIHEKSLQILSDVGIKVTGDRMQEILRNAGAIIEENDIVKIPRKLVEDAIRTSPEQVTLYNRDGEIVMEMGEEKNIYFGSIAEQLEYLDYKTNKARPFLRNDIKTMAVLQDALPKISFTGMGGLINDIPAEVAGQIAFIDLYRNFTKVIQVVTSDVKGLKDILELCIELAGSKEELIERPMFFCLSDPVPPFMHIEESNERLIVCAEHGIPVTYLPCSMMGSTAPITPVSALIQNNVDVLAGLVMTQLVRPGTPYIYGSMPSIMDMKTTVSSYGAPEFAMCVAASSELAEYYKLPFYGTAGATDTKMVDEQCVAEIELQIMASLLSKANMVHDIGMLDHGTNISPMAIYLSCEIIDQISHFIKGVDVSDEMLLVDAMEEVGAGGEYLSHKSTRKLCRDIWYPRLFTRRMVNPDESDLMERAIKGIDEIVSTHSIPELDERRKAILDKYEKKWLGSGTLERS